MPSSTRNTINVSHGAWVYPESVPATTDDEKGYPDEEAKEIDETIYAYIDDEYFNLSYEEFIEKVIQYLD